MCYSDRSKWGACGEAAGAVAFGVVERLKTYDALYKLAKCMVHGPDPLAGARPVLCRFRVLRRRDEVKFVGEVF